MLRARFKNIGVCFAITLLAGCAGTPDPVEVAGKQQEASAQIFARQKEKGALLLVRMVKGYGDCSGYIKLRRLNASKPDESESAITIISGTAYRANNGSGFNISIKLPLSNVFGPSAKRYVGAFHSISPGRYVITYATCTDHSASSRVTAGGDESGMLGRALSYVRPLGGDSVITIAPGQIVDAGYIELQGTRDDPGVVASEATSAERDIMKSFIPDVYSSITFTKFGL